MSPAAICVRPLQSPGGQNRLATWARPQPSSYSVGERTDDGVFEEVTLAQVSNSANSGSVISPATEAVWPTRR